MPRVIRSRVNDFTLSQSCCGVALFRSCSFIPPDLGPNARAFGQRRTRHIRSMRFRAESAGFWLWEAVCVRVGPDVVLTFCDA